jgi:hypothetical protein
MKAKAIATGTPYEPRPKRRVSTAAVGHFSMAADRAVHGAVDTDFIFEIF